MDYKKIINDIFKQFKNISFTIKFWDKTEIKYDNNSENLFTLIFKTERSAKRLLSEGSLGFGESYMEGDIQIEGSLSEYFKIRHSLKKLKISPRLFLFGFFNKVRRRYSKRHEDIAYHYDTGNDFFSMILDNKTMAYSAGKFSNPEDALEIAQENKLDLICKLLDIKPNSEILDLGSGWGSFAKYAVSKYGSKVLGYSLSNAQLEYCRNTLVDGENSDHLSFEYKDMVEGIGENKQFDAVVVLESIEHVGKENLKKFFGSITKVLKNNGSIYIQTTGKYKPAHLDRFTLKYVFPGGYLPLKDELFNYAEDNGLSVEYFMDDTQDYIYTIKNWITNLEKNKENIIEMFDEKFYRLWELWLCGAKVAFEVNSINLFRIHLKKKE